MFTLEVLTTAEHLDPAAWDRLAGSDVLASHGWLTTLERHFRGQRASRYLLVSRHGEPVAAVSCAVVRAAPHGDTLDDILLGRLRGPLSRAGFSFLPALTVGQPWHQGSHILFHPDLDPVGRRRAALLLLEALEAEAAGRCCMAAFVGVARDQEPLVPLLRERRWCRASHEPLNIMKIRWSSLDEYRRSLPSHNTRKSIRREMNRSRRERVSVEELHDPAPVEARLREIAEAHYRRLSGRPFTYVPGFFAALKANLGGDARIYSASKEGEVVGVAVRLSRGGVSHFIVVAVDHDAAGNDFTYFRLAYYESIADAIARGDRLLCDGTGGYRTKARRGFGTRPLDVWCFQPQPLGRLALHLWLPVLSARMRWKVRREMKA